jgi:hypothetical protein
MKPAEALIPPFGEAPSRMHDPDSAARCLCVNRIQNKWRIPHYKLGSSIVYRESDLLAFLADHRVEPPRTPGDPNAVLQAVRELYAKGPKNEQPSTRPG